MSPSGVVIARLVNPEPAALVNVATMLAANSRSLALVVVTADVLLVCARTGAPSGHVDRIDRIDAAVLENPNVDIRPPER